jgi:hypothetical protein
MRRIANANLLSLSRAERTKLERRLAVVLATKFTVQGAIKPKRRTRGRRT